MALIDYIDGPNRRIYLGPDSITQDVHPIDIYKEMRTLRRTDESLRKFDVFLTAEGNVPKGGGKFTERYVICKTGTKIVPYDATHVLTIIGTIITDDGQDGVYAFDRSPLTSTTIVDINYIPPQVEVIEVNIAGGSGSSAQELWEYADRQLTNNDANVISVAGVSVSSVDDFKADLSLVPQAVWEYVSRTIEFTPQQQAQFDQILLDIEDEAQTTRNTVIATS